ncbi:MAG TPA: hypothetical protein VIU14_09450 [Mesorhizobium sp.]|jgi:hypothetical protein
MHMELPFPAETLDDLIKLALVTLPVGLPISTRDVLDAVRDVMPGLDVSDAEIVDKIVRLASGWTMALEFDHAA